MLGTSFNSACLTKAKVVSDSHLCDLNGFGFNFIPFYFARRGLAIYSRDDMVYENSPHFNKCTNPASISFGLNSEGRLTTSSTVSFTELVKRTPLKPLIYLAIFYIQCQKSLRIILWLK